MNQKEPLFDTLNNFFDHIYLITLRKSSDRHEAIKENLNGLNYDIRWGVDGSKLHLDKIQNSGVYDRVQAKEKIPLGRELTKGEIGCALSHVHIYEDIIENNYNNALILEDDVEVEANIINNLTDSFSELPQDWDLLYLGYLYNNHKISLPILLRIYFAYPVLNIFGKKKYSARKLRCKFPRSYSNHLDLSGFHYGTHAYAVTLKGAKKILRYQTPITMAPDNAIGMMCMEELLNAFMLKKRLFDQNRNFATTIKNR